MATAAAFGRPWPRLSLEPRMQSTLAVTSLSTLFLAALALFFAGLVILAAGGQPLQVFRGMFGAAFGGKWGISDTLVKATPLILTTLGVSLAFRMRLWNIGAEGQLYLGALCATGIALRVAAPEASRWAVLCLMALAGFAGGAAWGAIPGWLRAQFNVNEIISTLMLNYVALALVRFFVFGPWSERGFGITPQFPRNAWLPRLMEYADVWPWTRGMTAHAGLFLALLAFAAVFALLRFTKFGFEIAVIGDNPDAARYAGINLRRVTLYVMLCSGGLAGLAGMSEASGVAHRLLDEVSPGYGFTAIIIAWLARLNPVNALWVSFLFGGLLVGADEIQSAGVSQLLQGIVLFVMVSGDLLLRYRIVLRWPARAAPPA